jgi:ParB-like chromosome segregation protein Spo0J
MILKIKEIILNDNRRKLDLNKVKQLAESIEQIGLINPITVNKDKTLIAGNHRIEAYKLLGRDEIEASFLDLNKLLADLAEIDENLMRNELHWIDADKQIARRKAIYLELYPETKAGGDRKSDKIKIQTLDSDNKTFIQDTADKTNKSKSSISQSVKRGNEITEEEAEVLKAIDAPKSYGDELIKQPIEKRAKIIENLKIEVKPIKEVLKDINKEEKIQQKEEVKAKISEIINEKYSLLKTIDKGWHKIGNQFLYFGNNTDSEFIDFVPSCKMAFADPPYNAGVDDWDFNFVWAQDYLQDIADVVCVTPGGWDAQNFYRICNMNYKWEMACWIRNGMTHGRCGYANWIKVAIFAKDKVKISQDFFDITIKTSETDDTKHKGRKPYEFMAHLIGLFTSEGDNIIDPFAGSGTTLIMAEKLNRVSYNAEMSEQYCLDILNKGITNNMTYDKL